MDDIIQEQRIQYYRLQGWVDADWKEDDGSGHGRNNICYGLESPSGEQYEYDQLPDYTEK